MSDHECDSGDFDRTLCGCQVMHSYCTTCGDRQDLCGIEDLTPSNRHANRATSDENDTRVVPEGSDAPDATRRHLRNLAQSHAREADRLAHTTAGITHALLAHFWLNNAQEQPR